VGGEVVGWDLKDYEPVEDRIRAFYSDHSDGRILTEIEHHNDDFSFVVFKASAFIGDTDSPAATGHAYEKASQKGVNATSHIENCETSAIGRALANLGYGAKGKRPSREEMQKVVQNSETAADAGAPSPPAQNASVPAVVSDQSQKPEGTGGEESVPPASDWTVLIETYGASNVLQVAQAKAKEANEAPPFTKKALGDLSSAVLEAVSTELAQRERVAS
jgi:hypothetical protein